MTENAQRRPWALRIFIVVMLLGLVAVFRPKPNPIDQSGVVTAKGGVIGNHMLAMNNADIVLNNLALNDPILGNLLNGKDVDYLSATPLGESGVLEMGACSADCLHLTYYNYSDGGTIEAIYNPESDKIVQSWMNTGARPNPSPYVVPRIVDIAAVDDEVQSILGDISKAEVAMVPMSTWIADNECNEDWCVDLTFFDPAGSGRVFHVIVNLDTDQVSRTFFTRTRQDRTLGQFDDLNDNAPLYSDGCHEQYGWNICWEMTPHDGVNFYNAAFDEQLIFSSAKIGLVEAYYASWPGGYRDEIGYAASVPPKFDTRLTDTGDGFEVRQLFTEPFNWPNCICCYRYEQIIQFNEDGSFEPRFISHGPGCDELAEYRPFWRIDIDLGEDGNENDELWFWDTEEIAWSQATTEVDLNIFGGNSLEGERLATFDDNLHYKWLPEANDPLGLDKGRIFVVESEGNIAIEPGPADTYAPPKLFADGESLESADSDYVVWYIPELQTKRGDPWWCYPEPDPDFSPCEAVLRVVPDDELRQPTAEEIAQIQPTPTPTPEPPDTAAIAAAETREPPPRAISGQSPDELILNSGCGACHVIGDLGEEGKVGPNLNNIGNIAAKRVPGQSAETYLYNSIIYPNIYLAPDCPNGDCLANIMPNTYHLTLDESQVNTLVDYMLTLTQPEPDQIGGTTAEDGTFTGDTPSQNGQTSSDGQPVSQNLMFIYATIGFVGAFLLFGFVLLRGRKKDAEV